RVASSPAGGSVPFFLVFVFHFPIKNIGRMCFFLRAQSNVYCVCGVCISTNFLSKPFQLLVTGY
ncbi:MAG: hypothetical protein ACK56I_05190, partial [bacterium]